ncbi:MAG TPA: helix-turn-helix transcriptional regulator [Candidatus Eisenbacteria bacterium]|nr:helix-turn-helix transcriptional regulator [Candidatus Eisenbacteria bacterium]
MADRLDLHFRAHTVPVTPQKEYRSKRRAAQPKDALIFRCATTDDEKKDLLFGSYVCAELEGDQYVAKEIGLFYREGHPEEFQALVRFVTRSAYEIGSLEQFRRNVFLKYLKARALIVAYDAPAEISRVAIKWNKSSKIRRAFSFYFRLFRDKKTGKIRPSPFDPGISIESLDAAKAIYRPIKYRFHDKDADQEEDDKKFSNIHILDLKTLTSVVTGKVYSFRSACDIFGAPASRHRKSYSRVTKPAIERLLRDVTAELELLNRLTLEFQRHPVDLLAEHCYSPATLAKSYSSEMGIKPPQEKFKIPDTINGIASQSGAGGRAECSVRQTPVPVTYVDFHAQFPAVSHLLNCREILCAESLEFADFTKETRELVERASLDDCFRPKFWKGLRWFALVEPNDDVVGIRARFSQRADSDPTMAWNYLTSKQAIWMTGPDVIAAKLMTGKPLKILKAIKVVPHGVQTGLVPVKLRSEMKVDPRRDDLAVKLVELRSAMKSKKPELAGGLKVAANSAAFGIYSQIDVRTLDSRSRLRVFSGEMEYQTPPTEIWERPSEFHCPVISSLVTGGSHLLCAMLERTVRNMCGQIAAMDTDSAMIVSTKDGDLIPCAGGPHNLAHYQARSGNNAIRALSFTEVESIRERFERLSPWRKTLKTSFLKLEAENFDATGNRQQLNYYGIAAKLYCLFNLEGSRLVVRKPSGHGLGFLQAPYTIAQWQRRTGRKWKEDLPPWIYEAWHFELSRELGLPHRPPSWLKQPAVMAVPITTPQIRARLGVFKDDIRPFTVMTVPFPKRETVQDPLWTGYFIMPQPARLNDLHGRTMVNIMSGEAFHIYDKHSSKLPKPPGWLSLRTMEDEINRILSRAESKFCDPNGGVCTPKTIGLLARRHIVAGEFHYIGKEASTRWAGGVDLSMMPEAGLIDPADETSREYERVVDPKYLDQIRTEAKQFSTKNLSRKSGIARSAIMNFKKGRNSIKPRTLRKLIRAIHVLQNKT